jgi:hypothetical protein
MISPPIATPRVTLASEAPTLIITLLLFGLIVTTFGFTNITIYKNPLSELSAAATRTRLAVETISAEANRAKVTSLALDAAQNSKRFGTSELADLIPEEFIKARSYGLSLIERLATRLLEVIDSEQGTTVAKGFEDVGRKAGTLASQLDGSKFAHYAGPVSSLAGTVVQMYDQVKREDILKRGVNDGIPQAQAIIAALKQDFQPNSQTNVQNALLEELEQQRTEQIDQYDNLLRSELKLAADEKAQPARTAVRLKAIQKIIASQDALNALNAQPVSQALDDLSAALENLRQLVNSDGDPKKLASLAAQLTTFSDHSVQFLEAVHAIQTARVSTSN